MALTEEQYIKIRKELEECNRPMFIFHDDPDGLCSFLLLYRLVKEGKGVIVKSSPRVDEKFLRNVEGYGPDKIFILDLALVDQEFLDGVKVPVIWIDHHSPLARHKVKYFNPRVSDPDDNQPVSYLCYNVADQDMWISAVGCVGDWFWPPFAKKFKEEYPDLLPAKIKKPEEALFNSKLGELVQIFSYILKGKTGDVLKCMKILTRIRTPYEILNQETSAGKFIYQRAEKIRKDYESLLKRALKDVTKDKLLLYIYSHARMSFTKELANELLYRYPKKKIMICREKNGEMKCSLRSSDIILPPVVEEALSGVDGYGGGHEHACGVCVKVEDFNQFVDNFKKQL